MPLLGQSTTKNDPMPLIAPIIENYEWQEQGNCVGVDTNIFFPESNLRGKNKAQAYAKAKSYCKGCPVVSECLEFALKIEEPFGVYGGLTEDERRVILRRKGTARGIA